jgi:hypothetical protein
MRLGYLVVSQDIPILLHLLPYLEHRIQCRPFAIKRNPFRNAPGVSSVASGLATSANSRLMTRGPTLCRASLIDDIADPAELIGDSSQINQ